ncbi:hypothetical protein [Kineococcus rubinsiae]|uniref:hypothetical protein n=1 Tax=Kineococcus rubinsiae TaxID=2609562 RepID=UPI00143215F3|nr:hypothetical protein [Kineococcus rubinsiae]NIZ90467.1 hypothetical protein [Kineococcus rubinsiae]
MGTGRRCSTGLRLVAALAAILLWSAPSARAEVTAAAESVPVAVTSASWGVVMSTAAQGPYTAGTTAAVSGALLATRYVTVASTGSRSPGTVTYLYSGDALALGASLCPTPWTALATCAGGQDTTVPLNQSVSGAGMVPPGRGVLYMKLNFLAGSAGTLEALATKPVTRVTTT